MSFELPKLILQVATTKQKARCHICGKKPKIYRLKVIYAENDITQNPRYYCSKCTADMLKQYSEGLSRLQKILSRNVSVATDIIGLDKQLDIEEDLGPFGFLSIDRD